jgi:hypothetical protein
MSQSSKKPASTASGYIDRSTQVTLKIAVSRRRRRAKDRRDRRRALAPYRSGATGVRGVSGLDLKANSEPGTAEHGLAQALGRPRHHAKDEEAAAFKKKFSAIVAETAAKAAPGKPMEIGFQML